MLTIFLKKLHRRCLSVLKIGFCLRVWNTDLTLVPSLQIKLRKYSARKYVWHCFWKGKRTWWYRKQNDCLCRSSRLKGSLKNALWEISQKSQENICAGISSLDKVKLCRSATLLKKRLWRRSFAKFVRTPFLQNTTGQLLLIIAVTIVVKGELGNKTVNYDTKTKAYVPMVVVTKMAAQVKEHVSEAVVRILQIRC